MWSRSANTCAPAPPACRATGSCFPASARPAPKSVAALEGGIRQFNVESEPEMRAISDIAASMGKVAPIAIRVNPDVDAKTHEKIATGKSENKFGIPIAKAREAYAEAARLPGLRVVGVDVHIGSQLTELAPVRGGLPEGAPS
jgi:diaminopimelate decarboxylase